MASDELKTIIDQLNKKYGDNTIGLVGDMRGVKIERVSSGSLALDYILGESEGRSGFPLGRMVELYGHPSSGKSLISLLTIAEAQKRGIETVYVDAENGFDAEFATKLGVDVSKMILTQVSIGEDTMDILSDILAVKKPMVVVIDSVASLVPMKEMDESFEQQNIALKARLMSRAMAKLTALNKQTLLLFINQIRVNVGAYGNPETTTGGMSLKHYASIRVEVRRGESLLESKRQIGQVVKFKITKNKTGRPFGEGYFKFYYDGHIDKIDELVTLGLLTEKISQNGAFYEVAGKKFKGREALEMELEGDAKYFEAVQKEVFKS